MKNQAKFKVLGLSLLLSIVTLFSSFSDDDGGIKGWFLAGNSPESYEIGVESNNGDKVAYLKSTKNVKKGFGTLMQQFVPKDYRGKRVKLTASIKSEEVIDWAGMWMRVDGADDKVLSFDNMQDRPIVGTTEWKECEIILDVPKESEMLAYGVLLSGAGNVWIDQFKFEVVEKSTETTGTSKSVNLEAPSNTSFEE
ncbi:MAG: hypothetical protein AB8B56_05375 [Crocinitomicaceae bacterium]